MPKGEILRIFTFQWKMERTKETKNKQEDQKKIRVMKKKGIQKIKEYFSCSSTKNRSPNSFIH